MLAPLLGVIMVFVLTALDPLGFESVTKAQSARIFYKIYAAAYPVATRDKISVVLLDNKTVEETFNDSCTCISSRTPFGAGGYPEL